MSVIGGALGLVERGKNAKPCAKLDHANQTAYLAKAPCSPTAIVKELTPECLTRFELQGKTAVS
jgi:hypothetical protein